MSGEEYLELPQIFEKMEQHKYIIFKILNVNRCYRTGHFSNFVVYKRDSAGTGIVQVPYTFTGEVNKKGEKIIVL